MGPEFWKAYRMMNKGFRLFTFGDRGLALRVVVSTDFGLGGIGSFFLTST